MVAELRLGIIGSSGGSALAAASECLAAAEQRVAWCVVIDRACGMADWARRNASASRRIDYQSAPSFSQSALKFFEEQHVGAVLLFYTRIVAIPLISKLPTFNIHPSVLPAFRGIGAIRRALSAGAKTIGATLHSVDQGLDAGRIVLQVETGIGDDCTFAEAMHISFVQKVWLTLCWYTMMKKDNAKCSDGNVSGALLDAFNSFQKSVGDYRIREIHQ